jgi:hypothetical protein
MESGEWIILEENTARDRFRSSLALSLLLLELRVA